MAPITLYTISHPPVVVTGGGIVAPTISFARSVSTHNTAFNVNNNGTSLSNNLVLLGGSAYVGATVSVFVNGSLNSTATTASDGSWFVLLGILADATYTITAKVTVGGNDSALSSNFNMTIAPALTGVTIGQNIPNTTNFHWGADSFSAEHDPSNANALIPIDTHQLHFTILKTDSWPADPTNRNEIQNNTFFANNQQFNVTYEFMLDSNYAPFDDAFAPVNSTVLTGQIHEDGSAALPVLACMEWGQNVSGSNQGDSPFWVYDKGGTFVFVVSGLNNIGRGVWHQFDMICKPVSSGASILKIVLNGTTYVNATDVKGSGTGSGYYWKMGIYRGQVGSPPHDADNAMYYRNLLIAYT